MSNRTDAELVGKSRYREHRGKTYIISPAHPAADLLPWMSDDELDALAEDIRDTEQRQSIYRLPDGRIIDGRNRELACLIAGEVPRYDTFDCAEVAIPALVASLNLHRRHLTTAQRKELAAAILRAEPEKSNNSIAANVGLSDKTVDRVRVELVSCSEIPNTTERRRSDGRRYSTPPPAYQQELDDDAEIDTDLEPKSEPPRKPRPAKDKDEPAHVFAELMARTTGLSRLLTQTMNGTSPEAKKLRAYLSAAGLVDNSGDVIEGEEYEAAKGVFLPLRGIRQLIDLAGRPGKLKSDSEIVKLYQASAVPERPVWLPPLTVSRRAKKGGAK